MIAGAARSKGDIAQRLAEAEATIEALLSGEIDAVVDPASKTPVLLARAQEALQQSQRRLRDIIDGLGPAMFVGLLTPQGILLEANRPALEAGGLTPEDVIGRPFADTYWWAYSPDVQQQLRETIARGAAGEPSRYDVRVRAADGQLIDVDFSLAVLRDAAGVVAFLVPSGIVITERKQMENALRESDTEFRTLAEAMPQIVWITRPDGWNVYFNQHWRDYTGLTMEESAGHGWSKPFHPDDQERAHGAWEHARSTAGTYSLECRLRRADGVYRWWLIRGVPLKDGGGAILKWFGTCTDIHDLKLAELENSRINRALKLLTACNEAVIRTEDEQDLLEQICAVAVAIGRYRMAWVGYAQDDAVRSITPMAHAGGDRSDLSQIHVTWNETDPRGQGPSGQVIRSGQVVVCEDLSQASRLVAWLDLARERGCRSVICLPLRHAKRTFGLLALYSTEVQQAGAEELILLQQMADDVAFGIERHRLEAAVTKSEERYRGIVETASEGVSILDTASTITFANGVFAAMLGYSAEEMVGKSLFQIVPEAAMAAAKMRVDRSRQGLSEENEVTYLRKDGSEVHALIKTSPVCDAEGKWLGTLGMTTDRTGHREAEEALRTSEEQYRQIVETTTEGIIKVDAEALIVFVNRRFAEMLGYEQHEMVGESLFAFMDADAKVIVAESLENRRPGVRSPVDTTYRHKDGRKIAVNVAGSPLVDHEGRHVGSLGVVRDVTEQKKMQSQLMVSDRMASVGTLAAGVAHEINNPLAAVIANLDYIVDSMGPAFTERGDVWLREEIKGPLGDAREAAQRVRFIVRDLKVFSRSPADESRVAVNVQATMESSLRMAWNEIRHRARLVKDYAIVPGVTANEARLGQVFLNLLINAAQALPEGRAEQNEVRVTTRADGDRVVVEVRDTGAGISPEIIGRIFDPFFTTKAVGVGTGLGLAICQRIVTDMGGELTVESDVGVGTMFRVTLPMAPQEEHAATATEPAPIAGRRGRILVVDDEELVLRSVKRVLANEHDVTVIGSAPEALALCAAGETFDLILCDLMMPEMTGMDLHGELSRVAPEQAGRMIFITGGAFTEKARSFLTDPPKEQIEKPFQAANLRAIVQRYLRMAPPLPSAARQDAR